jgi:hypothetical protein
MIDWSKKEGYILTISKLLAWDVSKQCNILKGTRIRH